MRRLAPLMLTIAVTAGACGGADDEATPTTPPATSATTEPAPTDAPTTTETTTTTTTVAPTTTIDEAAILAEAEAAYLEAFEAGKKALRNPGNQDSPELLSEHFTGANLELANENLRRAIDGGFIARVNEERPSNATVVESAEFIDNNLGLAHLTVCEFNSDKIYEVGTAPDGGDALRRDDPVSILIDVRMELVDGRWKSQSGTLGEEIRDEENQCGDA